MNRRMFAIILLIPFLVLSAYAVQQVGYWGIFDYHRHSPAGWQVITDLVIAILLIFTWMIPEAKRTGRNPWPYVVISVFLGSIGPLLFMVLEPRREPVTA